MPIDHSHHIDLNKSRELIALAERLTPEYAELRAASLVLRKESRQLREDSNVLRRASTRLLWREFR